MIAVLAIATWIGAGLLLFEGFNAYSLGTSGIHQIYAAVLCAGGVIAFGLGSVLIALQLVSAQASEIIRNTEPLEVFRKDNLEQERQRRSGT